MECSFKDACGGCRDTQPCLERLSSMPAKPARLWTLLQPCMLAPAQQWAVLSTCTVV